MKTIDGIEIKPCPFCGGEELIIERATGLTGYYVACMGNGCSSTGPWDLGVSGAIDRWNTRVEVGQ